MNEEIIFVRLLDEHSPARTFAVPVSRIGGWPPPEHREFGEAHGYPIIVHDRQEAEYLGATNIRSYTRVNWSKSEEPYADDLPMKRGVEYRCDEAEVVA